MNLLNFKKSNKDKPTIINPNKELADIKKQEETRIANEGKNIASKLSIKDENFDANTLTPVVQINSNYQGVVDDVGAVYNKNLSIYKSNFDELDEYENKGIDDTNDTDEINTLQAECENVLSELNDGHDDDLQDKKDRQDILKTDIKNGRTELSSQKKHNLKPLKIASAIIILIIMGGEIYANKDSFSFAGFSDPAPLFMGFAIAMVSAMCGVGKANIIRSQKFSKITKILSSVGILCLIVLIYLGIGTIRSSLMTMESDGIFELSAFYFMVFNLAFYVGIFLCKMFVYPSPQKISDNEKHAVVKAKLDKDVKEYKRLQNDITNSYKVREQKRKGVKQQYSKLIQPFKVSIKTKNNALKDAILGFNAELELAKSFYWQANSGFKACVAQLFSTINMYSSEGSGQVVLANLTDLKNPFENMELLAVPKIETPTKPTAQETTQVEPEEPTAWEVHIQNNQGSDDDTTNFSFNINSEKE